ncbi:hypothetical protein ACFYVR_12500 [Rhodococcus sp. NPDC003318]|uniref:hypothetical protein n=1 Tax=Rhodococcus sp. NPDC003318 TaxID=3364503 RepID=UPI0036B392C6
MRTLVAAALLVLALTGCSESDSSDAAPSPSPPAVTRQTPTVAAPTSVAMPDDSSELTAAEGLVDTHPITFESYTVTGDAGDRVAVHFDAGVPECFGAEATVTETDASVTIALRTGTLPAAVGKACTMQIVPATLEVPLAAPLGDRQVVSG